MLESEAYSDQMRTKIGIDMFERYTGSSLDKFQPYILLCNLHKFVMQFSKGCQCKIFSGGNMSCCHDPKKGVSIINYGVGSPVAALIVELLSFVRPKAVLMLGMCGGLREDHKLGDFFNPVAAIRGEGTSFDYVPQRCPSLSSFVIQRYVCEELDRLKLPYRTGVIHTTNVRFWEFKEDFKVRLKIEGSQAIDMECATLFSVGFASKVPVGALMTVSDLPLQIDGIKTKKSSRSVFELYAKRDIDIGINVLLNMQKNEAAGFKYNF